MALVYVGIDEAGYGPMLGPLAVAMTVFRVDAWTPDKPAPDLWKSLRRAVSPTLAGCGDKIPIADSKRLKLANDSRTRHPLTHLERGALAMLATSTDCPACDETLFATVGASLASHPWYAGEPCPLPIATDPATLAIDAAALRAAMHRAGVSLVTVRCNTLDELGLNEALGRRGSKAAVSGELVARLLGEAVTRCAADGDAVRVAVDRQSGRADYTSLLAEALPGHAVSGAVLTDGLSRYQLAGPIPGQDIAVRFQTEAERHHLPVALASMFAKLVRELAMIRFNRYWSALMPELKPTAGYYADARRWLRDAQPVLTDDLRARLVRRA